LEIRAELAEKSSVYYRMAKAYISGRKILREYFENPCASGLPKY
jgi:hypothetical protein